MVSELSMTDIHGISNWSKWDGTDDEWNEIVLKLENYNLYQSAQWARHKASSGWSVIRMVRRSNNALEIAAQCLFRPAPFKSVVVLIPGGPIGYLGSVDSQLVHNLKHALKAKLIYVRCSMMSPHSSEIANDLSSHGWRLSPHVIGARASLIHHLDVDQESRLTRCSSDWKRNLKRSKKIANPPYAWTNPDAVEISAAYSLMDQFKQVKGLSLARSVQELQSLIETFGNDLLLFRSDDVDGSPLAIRGALRFGDVLWDFIALTTPSGRKTSASYAVFWMLAETCFQLGIKEFDLSGIDPVNNRGVYDFKKGTGADQIDFQGEWEIASPKILRAIASKLISRRVS